MPERLQRSRKKGWRTPVGAVYVGRPTIWGNPWRIGTYENWSIDRYTLTADDAVGIYRDWITDPYCGTSRALCARLPDLRGRDLICWCPLDQPCHADVLLELANAPVSPSAGPDRA